jgi:metal-responsive CopG/Arc/MetJ family transcriptional regulator
MSLEKKRDIRLTVDLSNALDNTARAKGMNASQVVRLALREYFTREISLSNRRRNEEIELSNPATSPDTMPTAAVASDADLVGEWDRFYGTDLRTV